MRACKELVNGRLQGGDDGGAVRSAEDDSSYQVEIKVSVWPWVLRGLRFGGKGNEMLASTRVPIDHCYQRRDETRSTACSCNV